MLRTFFIACAILCAGPALWAQPRIQLQQFATGFSRPVDIAHCGDSRLFICEQRGIIWIVDSTGARLSTPFLDIDARINSNGNEQGLLGLAFPPNFAQTGHFFVNYTQNNGDTRISRFSLLPGETNVADPSSEIILIEIDQPFSNHNGGCMKFGADGYLYISEGDGGSGGDPQNNGQKKNTLLGKILRIDINVDTPPYYAVPADNPFVGQSDYLPEIWSLGWRNVWRFSIDRLTGDLWLADVGQNVREEINFEPAGQGGGNYGWRCYEGTAPYNTNNCQPASAYIGPVFEYNHSVANGCSVTGGFIYRGAQYPDLYGKYVFADYCSGRWWQIQPNADGSFTTAVLADLTPYEYSSFGEDNKGELYVAALSSGRIYKIRELCSAFSVTGSVVNATCNGVANGAIALAAEGGSGTVSYAWSNGATTPNLANLAAGAYVVSVTDGNQCVRRDTFVVANQTELGVPAVTSANGLTQLCPNDTLTLQSSHPSLADISYQWWLDGAPIPGANDSTLSVTQAGQYAVQWTQSGSGCQSESSALTVTDIVFIPSGIAYVQGELRYDDPFPGLVYQWFFEGMPIPGANGPVYTPQVSGNYSLEVAAAPCSITYSINVMVSGTRMPTDVLDLLIAPNPVERQLEVRVQMKAYSSVRLQVIDHTGRLVEEAQLEGAVIRHSFQAQQWPSGNYLLLLNTPDGVAVRKVVRL